MIKLSVDEKSLKNLNNQISMKIDAIAEMTKSTYLDELSKAAFVITGERFMKAADRHASLNPKKMHHAYEWNKIGSPSGRLFELKKVASFKGVLVIKSEFKKSKTPVPVHPSLLIPGDTGKFVNRRSIFANKAQAMESGTPITFQAQRMLAFYGKNGLRFIQPGTIINIKNPGGVATKNSFSKFMLDWYNSNAQIILDQSGLYERIANDTSIALSKNNSGPQDSLKIVAGIAETISGGKRVIK